MHPSARRSSAIAIFLLAACTAAQTCAANSPPGPERVLVVYNTNWTGDTDGNGVQDSLQVAGYYMQQRGVPAANMLGVNCTNGGNGLLWYYYTGEWPLFYSEI